MLLEDKVAVVTGGSRGIGFGIAKRFLQEGATVVICASREETLAKAREELLKISDKIHTHRADVSDSSEVDELVKKVVDDHGTIDILVNNAGLTRDNIFLRMSEEDWDTVIRVNLKGSFLFTRACAKVMLKKRTGRIINITSVIGIVGNAGQANYAASKAGVVGLTKSVAKELAKRNITVNAIAPGFIQTDMTSELTDDQKQGALAGIPVGRFGEVDDIAELSVFLASEKSSYITGQVIHVDGGMVI